MKKLVTSVLVSGLVLGGAGLAMADNDNHGEYRKHGGYCEKGGKHEMRMERLTKELGLSEEQAKQMRAVHEKYQDRMQSLRERSKANRQQLREVMQADKLDQAQVKKLTQQQADIKAERIILHSQKRAEMNKLLTAEQQAKLKDKYKKYKGEYKRHHDDDKD